MFLQISSFARRQRKFFLVASAKTCVENVRRFFRCTDRMPCNNLVRMFYVSLIQSQPTFMLNKIKLSKIGSPAVYRQKLISFEHSLLTTFANTVLAKARLLPVPFQFKCWATRLDRRTDIFKLMVELRSFLPMAPK